MSIKWKKWNKDVVENYHGNMDHYRKLYKGEHAEIFPRAKHLIEAGEIITSLEHGRATGRKVQPPYMVANICKIIAEIPAMFISRSLGSVTSSIKSTEEQNEAANEDTTNNIEGGQGAYNKEVIDLQGELIKSISDDSNLTFEHMRNIVQHQVDGGLVGVPWNDERGLRIEFKSRDVYYEHEDGRGADLMYDRTFEDENGKEKDYVHQYREREEVEEDGTPYVLATHVLYEKTGDLIEPIEDDTRVMEMLGIDELETKYVGRKRKFICYMANDKTFMDPYGTSALVNQGANQDEVNWTLTRRSIIFEVNAKPRIGISKEGMELLRADALAKYGDETMIDSDAFQIFTLDDKGNGMEIYQIDVSKIGDIEWVKEVVRAMLLTTKTSQKAVDFLSQDGGGAESGTAKFYDLMTSIIKAEQIQGEYIEFIQQLFENCLWLANQDDPAVIIERPEIEIKDMIPVSRKERAEENNANFTAKTQSLETTVRRNNPTASEEWIEEELLRIEEGAAMDDTGTLAGGRLSLQNYMDNRDAQGNIVPVDEE